MATECMYDDAFTVQKVSIDTIRDFYYVSGMLPMVHQMITDVSQTLNPLTSGAAYMRVFIFTLSTTF